MNKISHIKITKRLSTNLSAAGKFWAATWKYYARFACAYILRRAYMGCNNRENMQEAL